MPATIFLSIYAMPTSMGSSCSKSQRLTFTVSDYPRTDPSLEGSDLRTRCRHAESPQICVARRRPARRLPTSAGGGGKESPAEPPRVRAAGRRSARRLPTNAGGCGKKTLHRTLCVWLVGERWQTCRTSAAWPGRCRLRELSHGAKKAVEQTFHFLFA